MQLEARPDTPGSLRSIRKFALETSFRKHLGQKQCARSRDRFGTRVFYIRREQEREDSSLLSFLNFLPLSILFPFFVFRFSLDSLYLVCSIAFVVFRGWKITFLFPSPSLFSVYLCPVLRFPLPPGARSPSLDKASTRLILDK